MNLLARLAVPALALVVAGCAAPVRSTGDSAPLAASEDGSRRIVMSVQRPQDEKDRDLSRRWLMMRAQWKAAMSASAGKAGIDFVFDDGDTLPSATPGTGVIVKLRDFRFLPDTHRSTLGVFAGNAWVDADVSYVDLQTGQPAGRRSYGSSSNYLQLAFAPMSEEQLQAICDRIVRDVQAR